MKRKEILPNLTINKCILNIPADGIQQHRGR